MNRNYTSQVNDYLQGGQGSAPRQNGAFANMVPRQAQLMDQPHMLAYINPAEEQMLRDMGGAGIPGPDGIPVYGLYESITGKKFENTSLGSALGVTSNSAFGSGGSLDNAYNAVTGGGYTGNSGSSEDMDRAAMIARNAAAAAAAALPTIDPNAVPWTNPDTGAVTNFYTDGTSVTGDPVAGFIPTTTAGAGTDTGATTDTSLMTPAQVTAYENFRSGGYGSGMDQDWTRYYADGGIRTDLAANRYDATIAANNLHPLLVSNEGFYESLTGKKFEDTLVGGAIGVTPNSILGSEGAADAAFTSTVDLLSGGGSESDSSEVLVDPREVRTLTSGLQFFVDPDGSFGGFTGGRSMASLIDNKNNATELYETVNSDTPIGAATGALTNVGTDTTTIAANQDDGAASTKGFYELATGTKFEDTLVGGAIGVTPDSILGSEGGADKLFTSGADLIDGGGKDASGNTFEGNGALSNIIAGTANTLGVSTFNEDAGLAGGEGSVYDVLTDVISPTKIITNVLTGGEGVAGTIGNALEGTATGEFLANNIPYIANQLRIDNDSASVDNVLNELAGSLTGQDAINATVGYVVNEAIDNAVASNKGSSYDGNVDLNGDGIGTIYTDTNNNQQFDEGENTFASDDIFTDYPMIDYNEDLVGTEIIDPIVTTSGPTREDRTTDETMDYTRRYIKDFSSHLPEYLRRFTVGEPIDGMFNEFVGEDGKTYYRTAEGEIYDAENFVNAAVGETASVGTGEKIVVGYTETDADGNSIDYDNEGNQVDGSYERDGYFGVQVPAPFAPPGWTTTEGAMGAQVIKQFWNPETGETYASSNSNTRPPEGSPWTSVQPDETPEGGFYYVKYDQEGNAIV